MFCVARNALKATKPMGSRAARQSASVRLNQTRPIRCQYSAITTASAGMAGIR